MSEQRRIRGQREPVAKTHREEEAMSPHAGTEGSAVAALSGVDALLDGIVAELTASAPIENVGQPKARPVQRIESSEPFVRSFRQVGGE